MVKINKGNVFYGLAYEYDEVKQDHSFKISYHLITDIQEIQDKRILFLSCKGDHLLSPKKSNKIPIDPEPWVSNPKPDPFWKITWGENNYGSNTGKDNLYSNSLWNSASNNTQLNKTLTTTVNALNTNSISPTITVPNNFQPSPITTPQYNLGYSIDVNYFTAPEKFYQIEENEFVKYLGQLLFHDKLDLVKKINKLTEKKILRKIEQESDTIKKEYLRKKLTPKV